MPGIMQISTATATGPGVADLAIVPDPIPAYGWTHRWESYAVTTEAGTDATSLRDLIGTSHLTINGASGHTGSTPPTVAIDAGGRYVLRFDAATERLSANHAAVVGSPYTYVAVFRPLTIPSSGVGVVMGTATTAQGSMFLEAAGIRMNGGVALGASPALTAGSLYIVTGVVNGASSVLRVSGRTEVIGNAGTGSPASISVGAGGVTAPTNALHMDFVAGYITPTALTLAQRVEMETALRSSHHIA